MQSFFLAFVLVFVLLAVLFKLFNKLEHVSVFFSFGMEHLELAEEELKLRFEKLFEPLGDVVSIFIVCC